MKLTVITALFLAPFIAQTNGNVIAHCVRADSGDSPEVTVFRISDSEAVMSLSASGSIAPSYTVKAKAKFNDYSVTLKGELSAVIPTEGDGENYDQKVELFFKDSNSTFRAWLAANSNLPDIDSLSSLSLVCRN